MPISTKRLYKSQTSNLKPVLYSAQWTFHQQFASLKLEINVDVHSLYWQLMHFTDWLCIIQYKHFFSYIFTYAMLCNLPTVIKKWVRHSHKVSYTVSPMKKHSKEE